jgi:hypothetical protein
MKQTSEAQAYVTYKQLINIVICGLYRNIGALIIIVIIFILRI